MSQLSSQPAASEHGEEDRHPPASLLPLRYIIEALNLNLDAAMQQPDFKDTLCQEQEGLNHNFDVNELATVGVGVHPTGPRRAALDDHP